MRKIIKKLANILLFLTMPVCVAYNLICSADADGLKYYRGSEKAATYKGDGVKIVMYTGRYHAAGGKAKYYAAHVQLTDYEKMHLEKANGKRSSGFQTVLQMVKSKNTKAYRAVLAVNGPFNGEDDKKWVYVGKWKGVKYHNYHEITNGKYHEGTLGFDRVSDCMTYSSKTGMLKAGLEQEGVISGMSLSEAASKELISDTFHGDMGYYVLRNGQIQGEKDNEGLRQRTFIGTNGKAGDFWIIVCNGASSEGLKADGYSEGLNTYGEGAILKALGCTDGYNLDGGGSSSMVFKGKMINRQLFARKCYDTLYIEM